MEIIKHKYLELCQIPSDINEHLPTLKSYASECESVLELGVRSCVSSWALATGLLENNKPRKQLFLNDINECRIIELLYYGSGVGVGLDVKYAWCNDLELNLGQSVDMTFIDTWHIYGQLKRELEKFSKMTNKYIIMHDTTVDAIHGETIRNGWDPVKQSEETGYPIEEITKGLWAAIEEFLACNPDWILEKRYENNNGLTILKKV